MSLCSFSCLSVLFSNSSKETIYGLWSMGVDNNGKKMLFFQKAAHEHMTIASQGSN